MHACLQHDSVQTFEQSVQKHCIISHDSLEYSVKKVKKSMTNGAKKVAFYAGVGVLAAILIISSVGFSGLKFPSLRFPDFFHPPPVQGTLTILIMDKPVELLHLNITIDWAKIKDRDENWYDLHACNRVFPDIIVHQRNEKRNLLVIELKKNGLDSRCDI